MCYFDCSDNESVCHDVSCADPVPGLQPSPAGLRPDNGLHPAASTTELPTLFTKFPAGAFVCSAVVSDIRTANICFNSTGNVVHSVGWASEPTVGLPASIPLADE